MTREEAMNLVKQVLPCLNIDKKIREAFETLIPELRENEDERIRMALIQLMTVAGENYVMSATGFEKERLIAYLEKQKEQPTNEEMLRTLRAEYEKGVADTIAWQITSRKEQKPKQYDIDVLEKHITKDSISELAHTVIVRNGWEIVEKGQKPVECINFGNEFENQVSHLLASALNSEYEYNVGFVKHAAQSLLEYAKNELKPFNVCEQCPYYKSCPDYNEQKLADNVSKEEYVKRFKALCDAYEIKLPNREYDIYHLCDDLSKLSIDSSKQMPVEWSKEDEDFINMLILHFNYLINKGGDSVETYKSYIKKLKSLRPQPHTVSIKYAAKFGNLEYERGIKDGIQSEKSRQWKPSEEHFQGLRRAILKADTGSDAERALKDLYEQLEKLRKL